MGETERKREKRETEGDGKSGAECGKGIKMEDVWREEADESKS